MDEEHPLTRQMRLPEIGAAGQAKLAAAVLEVGDGDGSSSEFLYLRRAGIAQVAISANAPAAPFIHHALFEHAVARRFASGAWRALTQMRHVLRQT